MPQTAPPIQPSHRSAHQSATAQGSAPITKSEKMRIFLEKKREKARRPPSPSSSDSNQVPSPLKRYEEEKKSDLIREAEDKATIDQVIRNLYMDLEGEEEEIEEVLLVRRSRSQQAHIEASGFEPILLAVLPPEQVETVEPRPEPTSTPTEIPESVPKEVREVSLEVVEVEIEKDEGAKASGRKKTTTSKTLKVHRRMKQTLERMRITRSTAKAAESAPELEAAAAASPPRQTRSKRSAQTRVDTGVKATPAKKLRVSSPSSKGKGKKITEDDTAKFLEVNFPGPKGKVDDTKLEKFQGTFAKKEIKPGKVVKIEELKD